MPLDIEIAKNRYYLDGYDMFTTWGVGVESGSEHFLKFPKKKDSTTYNWNDENGIDVDLSRIFIEAREAELKCFLIATTEAEFWQMYSAFIGQWQKPGTRRLTIVEFTKDYEVFYVECSIYQRITRIKNVPIIGAKFTLKIVEPDPSLGQPNYITDEADKFLIS